MGRKRTIYYISLNVFLTAVSCSETATVLPQKEDRTTVTVHIRTGQESRTETEEMFKDINLLVFDKFGKAEENLYTTGDRHTLKLVSGETYSFYACADFGRRITADEIGEMEELTFSYKRFLSEHPDRSPRCGLLRDVLVREGSQISIEMENLLVRVSLAMDRSMLKGDVSLNVTGLGICNCPVYTYVFCNQETGRQVIRQDLPWEFDTLSSLNIPDEEGRYETEIYLPEDTVDEEHTEDIGQQGCCHLEIKADYLSHSHFTSEGPLIYRMHVGDSLRCRGLKRNTHHKIIVQPEGDGLGAEGWRVDKTHLMEFGPSRFASFPESYIQGNIGDTLHLRCEFYPPHAPFDVGLEELEYDKAEGIYDYIIDEDGHGVRLILTGPGTGIVYMEAGSPVNEAAMWVIEVNLPSGPETVTDTSPYKSPCRTSTAQEFLQRQDVLLRHRPQARGLSPSLPHG